MALININPRLTAEENFRAILVGSSLTESQITEVTTSFANMAVEAPVANNGNSNTSADVTLTSDGTPVSGKVYWTRVEPLPAWVDNLVLKVPASATTTVETLKDTVIANHRSISAVSDLSDNVVFTHGTTVAEVLANGFTLTAKADSKVYVGADLLKITATFADVNISGKSTVSRSNVNAEPSAEYNWVGLTASNMTNPNIIVKMVKEVLIENNFAVNTFSAEDLDSNIDIVVQPDNKTLVITTNFDAASEYQGKVVVNSKRWDLATDYTELLDNNVQFSVNDAGNFQLVLTKTEHTAIIDGTTTIAATVATKLDAVLGTVLDYMTVTPDGTNPNLFIVTPKNTTFFGGQFKVEYVEVATIEMPLMLNGFGETLVLEDLSGFDVA